MKDGLSIPLCTLSALHRNGRGEAALPLGFQLLYWPSRSRRPPAFSICGAAVPLPQAGESKRKGLQAFGFAASSLGEGQIAQW